MTTTRRTAQHFRGTATQFHAFDLPAELPAPMAWVFELERAALALGSGQREDSSIDVRAVAAADVEVVRRRSGGGAVLMKPGSCLWIDVLVPRDDAVWDDDVSVAFYWLGELWAASFGDLGVAAEVYRGGLQKTRWTRQVCFSALGPGEVILDGRKLVGISQRRTRAGARFQCLVLEHWDVGGVVDLLALSTADRDQARQDLAAAATGPGVSLADCESAFLARFLSG